MRAVECLCDDIMSPSLPLPSSVEARRNILLGSDDLEVVLTAMTGDIHTAVVNLIHFTTLADADLQLAALIRAMAFVCGARGLFPGSEFNGYALELERDVAAAVTLAAFIRYLATVLCAVMKPQAKNPMSPA